MDRDDLRALLEAEGIRRSAYSLDGGLPDNAYCLDRDGADWIAYHFGRGSCSWLQRFRAESPACEYLLGLLRADARAQQAPRF
ncbi:hypothetical protein [Streptacidiphilus carbonis]|uniref:hypothetical protein n=1 Tax=Streptacidiphilus carbonis TaxID=105422 RepID=UPI0005A78123|nr:hypothetical protein [Streptacidiphilus carbonis]